jgi:seryl-tRNA synthetase
MRFFYITILLASSVASYRLFDIQNDANAYEIEIDGNSEMEAEGESVVKLTEELENTRADLFDMIGNEKESQMANELDSIQKKITELENSNKELKNELTKTQNDLTRRKVQNQRKTVANVQLETKNANKQEDDDFWTWICRISKHLIGGIMSLFGIRI